MSGPSAAGKQVPGRVRLRGRPVRRVGLPVALRERAAGRARHGHVDRVRVAGERVVSVGDVDRVHDVELAAPVCPDVTGVRERRRIVQVLAPVEQVRRQGSGMAVDDVRPGAMCARIEPFLAVSRDDDLVDDRDRLVERQGQRRDRHARVAVQAGRLVHRPRARRMRMDNRVS